MIWIKRRTKTFEVLTNFGNLSRATSLFPFNGDFFVSSVGENSKSTLDVTETF